MVIGGYVGLSLIPCQKTCPKEKIVVRKKERKKREKKKSKTYQSLSHIIPGNPGSSGLLYLVPAFNSLFLYRDILYISEACAHGNQFRFLLTLLKWRQLSSLAAFLVVTIFRTPFELKDYNKPPPSERSPENRKISLISAISFTQLQASDFHKPCFSDHKHLSRFLSFHSRRFTVAVREDSAIPRISTCSFRESGTDRFFLE